jgi:TorA maturation chaperone TorD
MANQCFLSFSAQAFVLGRLFQDAHDVQHFERTFSDHSALQLAACWRLLVT